MKKWFKKHGSMTIIGTLVFLLVGIIAFLVGGALAGWDIIGFLKSPTAILIYVLLLLAVLVALFFYTKLKVNGVAGNDE